MNNHRSAILTAFFIAAFVGLAGRAVWIQIIRADDLQERAERQSQMRQILPAPRGAILGRDGIVLAIDDPSGRARRLLPRSEAASAVLGMVGRDGDGLMGLELTLDRSLRGVDGWRLVRRTARGQAWPAFEEEGRPPIPGITVVTTIDPDVQEIAARALEEGLRRTGARQGVAVIVESASGDVLALASAPLMALGARRPQGKAVLPATQWTYEPGSTFKTFTLAAALEHAKLQDHELFDASAGFVRVAGQVIRDAHRNGILDWKQTLAVSSNVALAQIAFRLGPRGLHRAARDFGFGTATGIQLPGEESGRLRPPDEWTARSLPTVAIGQEIATTPLQLAMAYAALAGDGVLMRPRLVRAWIDAEGDTLRHEPPQAVRRVVSAATAERVRAALRRVVVDGTGKHAQVEGLDVMGKTGTAQKAAPEGGYVKDVYVASFAAIIGGFNPPLVLVVALDEPVAPHTGGLAAAPVAARIAGEIASLPDRPWNRRLVDRPEELRRGLMATRTPGLSEVQL